MPVAAPRAAIEKILRFVPPRELRQTLMFSGHGASRP